MEITCIRTVRNYEKWPSWDLVYEWEDIFREKMEIDFHYVRRNSQRIDRILSKMGLNLSVFHTVKGCELVWEMSPRLLSNGLNRKNVIPCIIDFFLKESQLAQFRSAYAENPFILISSAEVVEYLKNKNLGSKIYHLPLSISDRYRITADTVYEKKYDVGLMGRQNPVLENFLQKYIENHPDFVYVYAKPVNNDFAYYSSTGEFLGYISTREKYIELMRKCRMGFYSTPGIDGGEKRTNGFNQVTPKFLELLACGCHVIARYKENPDTLYYELRRFSPHIETYEAFEKAGDEARANPPDMKKHADYLQRHYTSVRVEMLRNILSRYSQSLLKG